MNFKKLGSVLSKRKCLYLLQGRSGVQWAGDDLGIYELSGMPEFTVDTMLYIFGVNMADRDKWLTKEDGFPAEYDTETENSSDQPIVIDDHSIQYAGTEFAILHTGRSCFVLPERYLKPIYTENMALFLRTMPETGETKIVAKEGLFVTAIFEPVRATQEMAEWVAKLCNEIR